MLAATLAEMPSKTPGSVKQPSRCSSSRSVVALTKPSSRVSKIGDVLEGRPPLSFIDYLELWRRAQRQSFMTSISKGCPAKINTGSRHGRQGGGCLSLRRSIRETATLDGGPGNIVRPTPTQRWRCQYFTSPEKTSSRPDCHAWATPNQSLKPFTS